MYDVLCKGTAEARSVAAETLSEVKAAMRINYFDKDVPGSLIKEQSDKYAARQ